MKLRNKETGETYERTMPILFNIKTSGGGEHTVSCKSITELNEKWEDYEEPKGYWYIDSDGEVYPTAGLNRFDLDRMANIGNLFETKEEAEKAIGKLKAWKRLKDKGFRFEGIREDYTKLSDRHLPFRDGMRYLHFNKSEDNEWMKENWDDLDICFGGEE